MTSIEREVGRSLVDRMISPYYREPALWPVAIVLVVHGVLGVAVALLDAIRGGMGFGLVSLVLLGIGTAWAFLRDARWRHFGPSSATLATCWVFGALCAWAADHYGLY